MLFKSAVLAAVAAAATLGAANAEAGVSWSIGINLPPVAAVVGAPAYRAPPVAYAPVPAYAAPVYAAPVYTAPVYEAPVVVAPPPAWGPRHRHWAAPAPVYGPVWRTVPRAVVYPYRPGPYGRWAAPAAVAPAPVYAPVPRW